MVACTDTLLPSPPLPFSSFPSSLLTRPLPFVSPSPYLSVSLQMKIFVRPRRFPACYQEWNDRVLFEDEKFLIINKPHNLPCQVKKSGKVEERRREIFKERNEGEKSGEEREGKRGRRKRREAAGEEQEGGAREGRSCLSVLPATCETTWRGQTHFISGRRQQLARDCCGVCR